MQGLARGLISSDRHGLNIQAVNSPKHLMALLHQLIDPHSILFCCMQRMSTSVSISQHPMSFSLTASIITYLRVISGVQKESTPIAAFKEKSPHPAEPKPFHGAHGSFPIPLIIPFFLAVSNTCSAVCMPWTGQTEYITILKSHSCADSACGGREAAEASGLSCSCLCAVGVPRVTNSHRQ